MIDDELTRQAIADYVLAKCWVYLPADHNGPENRNEPPKHWSVEKRVHAFDTYRRAIVGCYELKVARDAADGKSPTQLLAEGPRQPLLDPDSPLQQIS